MYPFPDCTSIAVSGATCSGMMAADFTTLREIEKKQLISVAQLIRFYDL